MKNRKLFSQILVGSCFVLTLSACKVSEKDLGAVDESGCTWGGQSSGIVAGDTVGISDAHQQLVTLLKIRRAGREFVCTGTLISDRVVLTAAHCVAGVDARDVSADFASVTGCSNKGVRSVSVRGDSTVIHPEFDGSPHSLADIALITLEGEAPQDQQRIPLLVAREGLSSDNALLIGYGITGERQRDSQVLRRIYKNLQQDLTFKDRAIYVDQAKNPGGFCRGDSGAPILVRKYNQFYILGVNSANIGMDPDTECQTMSVAMDMSYFANWILQNR